MGTIEASGGASTQSGGGGGGRIAVYHYGISTFLGSLQAYGGESVAERGGNISKPSQVYKHLLLIFIRNTK